MHFIFFNIIINILVFNIIIFIIRNYYLRVFNLIYKKHALQLYFYFILFAY